MPEMNGLEATIEIRKHNQGLQIVAVTAFTSKCDIESCFEAGMNNHGDFLIF